MPNQDRRYDVFLSHNSADKPAVKAVADRLREAGLDPFLDIWHLIPGTPWQEGIEEALAASATAAVFVGPSGISPWHNEEMRDALDRAVRSRDDYRVIPVLLPGANEGSVSRFLARRVWVDFRTGLDDEEAFQRLIAGIKGEAIESRLLPACPTSRHPTVACCPSRPSTLASFSAVTPTSSGLWASWRSIRSSPWWAPRAAASPPWSKPACCPGAGSKRPARQRQWRVLTLTPGSQPLRALASQLATLAYPGRPPADRRRPDGAPASPADGLHARCLAYTGRCNRRRCCCSSTSLRSCSLCARRGRSAAASRRNSSSPTWLTPCRRATGRSVCSSPCAPTSSIVAWPIQSCVSCLEDRQLLLGPMDEPALREAIVRPAAEVGALFEKGLVEIILRDVGSESGILPLVQQALYELWLRRKGPWLTSTPTRKAEASLAPSKSAPMTPIKP